MFDSHTTALLSQMGFDPAMMESLMASAIALTVLAILAAIPTTVIARKKCRSRTFWLLFALSIPLLPLLLIWLLPALKKNEPSEVS